MSETRKDEMPTNTKCPRCGYVTADPFNCAMCKMEPNERTPTPPEQGEPTDAQIAERINSVADDLATDGDEAEDAHLLREGAKRLLARVPAETPTAVLTEPEREAISRAVEFIVAQDADDDVTPCDLAKLRALATPPAAQPGEPVALSKRVVRNEPGVTEIHVEARDVVRDGPMRVECWWSEDDRAYLAQLTDAEESTRPFTATHTAHGDTREQALAHLAIGEYVTALVVAQPIGASGEGDDALFKLRRAINGLRVSEFTSMDGVAWADEIEGRLDAYLSHPTPVSAAERGVTEATLRQMAMGYIRRWAVLHENTALAQIESFPEAQREEMVAETMDCLRAALSAETGELAKRYEPSAEQLVKDAKKWDAELGRAGTP